MFSFRGPKLRGLAGLLSILCLIAGIYLSFFHSRGFVKTTATILSLREDDTGEDTVYFPTVQYTVDGKTYTGELDTGSSSYRVGKIVTVLYDPQNPAVVHDGGGIGLYLLIMSAAILVFLLVSIVKEKQSQKRLKELQETRGGAAYAPSVQGEERELYFLTDTGTAKYGHRIEDRERRVLYEAKMTKFSLNQPFGFDFIDHEHVTTTPHLVGHEEESSWGNSLLLDNHYTFELDGEEVWTHLKRHGIRVETERIEGSIRPRYRVFRDGTEIAVLEATSRFVHEEDAAQHSVLSKVAVPGYYRIWTREENLDAVFVTALAFARSGALNDEGGTFGKNIRQSLKADR